MSIPDSQRLDADELLHFALRAIEGDDDEQAIAYLKRAIDAAPQDGKPWLLLAGVHAGLGLHDRALEDLMHATRLSPELHQAHFHLGYVHLLMGQTEEAELAWRALDELAADDPLRLFKHGLMLLTVDDFEAGIAALEQGLALSDEAALNEDMRAIVRQARTTLAAER